ncbi:3'-5' exonuclease [Xanthobacteraceae bacterium Astr-EGSB]|uniref:3'-5' exonuclease n=1 Tax=Astrobacterium formosum TaxID=3069710 RepID=UPI0027AF38DD|nr:3'-5' exonuclease [Xanthobacteraceae bacterium Astr-EGSB]
MPTVLAESFIAAIARLSGDEQKQVKLTVYDLQTEPDRPSLQFHRIDKSKDPNFWSVRVSRDVRIVVHKTGASLLLAYVGHHDDAYRWAERRRIETHPKTGAVQIVEVRERVEEIAIQPVQGKFEFPAQSAAPAVRLFEHFSRDDLLSVGVPTDWIDDVRTADEDLFLALANHLPAEATEALLDCVSTGVLKRREAEPVASMAAARDERDLPLFKLRPPETPADRFEFAFRFERPPLAPPIFEGPQAHPDTLRRFRVVENVAEMEAALSYPWDKWAVFLHPAQRDLIERAFSGPVRVAGSAGTGKTVVALHRAMHHLRRSPDARVLLTTFSEPLANALRLKLAILAGADTFLLDRVAVASFRGIAEELHQLVFARKAHLASREVVRSLVGKAMETAGIEGISPQFVLSEWANVVDAWQIADLDGYAAVPRMGRRARLGARQRESLWPVFDGVRRALDARRLMTPASLFATLTAHYAGRADKPFTHIVVDEAQDLGVPELRFLAAIAPDGPDALFFAGDVGQRIFQPPFSWKGLGIDVRGRSFTLRVNYRTSHQIRLAADRLLPRSIRDVDGLEDDRKATVSVFNGPAPEIVIAATADEEIEEVARFIRAACDQGIEPGAIGIFVRSRDQLPRARAAAAKAEVEATELTGKTEGQADRIVIGIMHFAKGLEFRAAAVMACDEEVIPAQERIADVSDEMELDEVYATERQLLYVAATRARDRLLVTGVAPASEFLSDMSATTHS